jgi:hypothetical protein
MDPAPDNQEPSPEASRGRWILFWVIVVFMAINAAVLYRVVVGP